MDIGRYLRMLRKNKGVTLRDVSETTKLSISYISDLERGRQNPSLSTCAKLAAYYDVSLSKLFAQVTHVSER